LFHFRAQQSAAAAAAAAGGAGGMAGGAGCGSGSQSRPGSRKLPPPLLRSRTLPAIIVPGLPVVSLHTDKQTFQLGAYNMYILLPSKWVNYIEKSDGTTTAFSSHIAHLM